MEPITDVEVELIGKDGNAFAILGAVSKALRKAGYDKEFIDEYLVKAKSGNYEHMLHVTMTYVHVK
jgi:hypothetical protein